MRNERFKAFSCQMWRRRTKDGLQNCCFSHFVLRFTTEHIRLKRQIMSNFVQPFCHSRNIFRSKPHSAFSITCMGWFSTLQPRRGHYCPFRSASFPQFADTSWSPKCEDSMIGTFSGRVAYTTLLRTHGQLQMLGFFSSVTDCCR